MSDTRLRLSRLAPAAPNGRDAVSVYLLVATAALFLALAWLAFSAVRPLASAQAEPLPPVADVPSVDLDSLDFAARRAALDELTSQNHFAHGRGEWRGRPTAVAQNEDSEAETEPTPSPITTTATDSRVVNERGEVLNVAEKGDASDAMQLALENLGLRGLYTDARGVPHAMIVRKHEEKPGYSTPFTIGEEFTEQKTAASPWRVEHIDLDLDRVALSRNGETVWLNLRERTIALAPQDVVSNRVFDPATSVPVVQQITMDELRASLIREGLDPAEVDAMIAAAEAMDPEREARTAVVVDAMKQINAPHAAEVADASAAKPNETAGSITASPDDIEKLFEMMANNIPPTPEMMEKFNNPQPVEEKKEQGGEPK